MKVYQWFYWTQYEADLAISWRVWRNQKGNQNPWIADEKTIQWSNEKGQKDNSRSAKHYTSS